MFYFFTPLKPKTFELFWTLEGIELNIGLKSNDSFLQYNITF